jgi:hypothetical protein
MSELKNNTEILAIVGLGMVAAYLIFRKVKKTIEQPGIVGAATSLGPNGPAGPDVVNKTQQQLENTNSKAESKANANPPPQLQQISEPPTAVESSKPTPIAPGAGRKIAAGIVGAGIAGAAVAAGIYNSDRTNRYVLFGKYPENAEINKDEYIPSEYIDSYIHGKFQRIGANVRNKITEVIQENVKFPSADY